jgi:hypothetical protein
LLVVLAVLALVVVGLKAKGTAGAAAGAPGPASDRMVLTEDLVAAADAADGVQQVAGGYVPGTGIVVTVTWRDVTRNEVTARWVAALEPLRDRLARTDRGERLFVVVDASGADRFVRTLEAPLRDAVDAAVYTISAARSSAFDTPAGTATATAAPAAGATAATTTTTRGAADTTGANTATANTTTTTPRAPANGATTTSTPTPPVNNTRGAGTATTTTAPLAGATTATTATPTVATGSTLYQDAFDTNKGTWTALAGQWRVEGGAYRQTDDSGFDFISQLDVELPASYALDVKMKAIEGSLLAGVVVNQPTKGKRNSATMVDFADAGTYLRWGHFDNGGAYVFDGGAKLNPAPDGTKGVLLHVEVRAGKGSVSVDGTRLGTFTAASDTGTVGLVTSQAKVEFDDMTVVAL